MGESFISIENVNMFHFDISDFKFFWRFSLHENVQYFCPVSGQKQMPKYWNFPGDGYSPL